jgi:hypothetical protein
MEEVAADATAARHLAAAHDRDLADLGVKVDAHRAAINALGEQTRERFDGLEGRVGALEVKVDEGFAEMRSRFVEMDSGFALMRSRFAGMDHGFAAMRHGFDQTAAGFARIAELVDRRDDER